MVMLQGKYAANIIEIVYGGEHLYAYCARSVYCRL